MDTRRLLAIAAILLGLGVLLYALFGGRSDEDRIRAQLHRLAAAVSFSQPGNPAIRGLKLKSEFDELFVETPIGEIPDYGEAVTDRDSLVELGLLAARSARSLDVRFSDIDVTVFEDATSARATARCEVVADRGDGADQSEERQVRFRFDKTDEGWKITRFAVQDE